MASSHIAVEEGIDLGSDMVEGGSSFVVGEDSLAATTNLRSDVVFESWNGS